MSEHVIYCGKILGHACYSKNVQWSLDDFWEIFLGKLLLFLFKRKGSLLFRLGKKRLVFFEIRPEMIPVNSFEFKVFHANPPS